jgi:RNA 2',3'-cyclic 3'-phosphodiesterase
VRLFVAFDVPEETRRALDELIRRFRSACRGARWMRADSVHVTLKFIGEADEAKLPDIKAALAQVRRDEAIKIAFRGFGFFPNEKHPRVFWAGMEAGPDLASLAGEINEKLAAVGIPREEKTFRPHLTLARFKTPEGLPRLREMLAALPPQEFGATAPLEFYLYQSVLKSSGAEYTRLANFAYVKGGA